MTTALHPFLRCPAAGFGKTVARLGLASRGGSGLTADDVLRAIDRGIGFLNSPGLSEGDPSDVGPFGDALATLGPRREEVVVCAQLGARTADEARDELAELLRALRTSYVDVLTLYYVEERAEWDRLRRPGGALELLRAAKGDGIVRRIGVTTHQRPLAAEMARSGELDALMVRYNAAHRGAERDVFPVTASLGIPVIAYTATRWGALLRSRPDDPPGSESPPAPAWYRFVLQHPAVSVALCAPSSRAELDEDIEVLAAAGPLSPAEHALLVKHGERVRRHGGAFP